MSRHLTLLCVAAAMSITAMFSPTVGAQMQSNLVVVLDGSGSMWGRLQDDRMKIVEAKRVTRELLEDVPAGVDLGFVAYGHRQKGDCADIETIAPLGTAPAAITDAVEGIVPRGKTPITDSLRHAAGLLSSSDKPSTLVLVSDGIETCQGDPCALAKELKVGGIDLIIHTVGFGVGDEAASQLQCVAEAGGGNYYHVTDGSQLRDALFAVREAVAMQEPPPPPPEPPKAEAISKKVLKIGPATISLQPAPWVDTSVYYWKVVDAETGEEKGQTDDTLMRVKAGEYQLVWRQSQHDHSDVPLSVVVSAAAGETVEVPVDTGIRPVLPEGFEPPYRWSLWIPGGQDAVAVYEDTIGPEVAPAGRYDLVWQQYQHGSEPVSLGTVEIGPGKLNNVTVSGLQVTPAEWVPENPEHYRLLNQNGDQVALWEEFGIQLAPPGTYQLAYQQSQHNHSEVNWGAVTVPEGDFVSVAIDSGVKFSVTEGTPAPYLIGFVELDSGAEYSWRTGGNWAPVPLPPGRYRLDWQEKQHGSDRITLLDEFTIESGTLVEFEM